MSDVKWQGKDGGPMANEQPGEVLIFDRELTACEIVKLTEVHNVDSKAGHTSIGKPWLTPEQQVEEIKNEIKARIAALPKVDFNAAAEVVGAVLNEYIDRGDLLDDEHALSEAVADVLDGVSG